MSYQVSGRFKLISRTVLTTVILAIILLIVWGPLKLHYFYTVTEHCARSHDLDWHWVPAFDARIERLEADSETNSRAIACINRWAWIIVDKEPLNPDELGRATPYLETVRIDPHVGASPSNLSVTYYAGGN